ncbi:MAG: sugar nucleotide-binding protein [Nanoarchaeota archaeon]|mgnify:CR=1 FL=1
MKNEKIFIFGASGFIGGYLFNHLKNKCKKVTGTYNQNKKPELIFFDTANSSIEELPLDNVKYGVICSTLANIDSCIKDLNYSNKVNVTGLEKVITKLVKKDIIPVFISSGAVFDGLTGGYKENDLRNPKNIYGIQKKQMEDFMISNLKDYLILRIGKVFGINKRDNGKIFMDWIEKYKRNEEIKCAYDEELSLTSIEDAVKCIEVLLDQNKRGIFHIDSGIHKSRFDFAKDFFDYLKIKDANLIRCSLDDFNFSDKRAKKPYLDSSKVIKEIGFSFTSLDRYYEIIKNQI